MYMRPGKKWVLWILMWFWSLSVPAFVAGILRVSIGKWEDGLYGVGGYAGECEEALYLGGWNFESGEGYDLGLLCEAFAEASFSRGAGVSGDWVCEIGRAHV